MPKIWYFFYTFLSTLACLIFPFYALFRSLKDKRYLKSIFSRLDWRHAPFQNSIWIHAVSVGEFRSIYPLLHELLSKTKHTITLTITTPTAKALADNFAKDFQSRLFVAYAPLEHPLLAQKFLRQIKPQSLWLIETELWYHWIHAAKKQGVSVYLLGARLSSRSFRGYQKILPITQAILALIDGIVANSSKDLFHFKSLGYVNDSLVAGSMKYDATFDKNLLQKGNALRGDFPSWCIGSSRKGEEVQFMKIHQALRKTKKNLRLAIIPRHLERLSFWVHLIEKEGFKVRFYDQNQEAPWKENEVLLMNQMGESLVFYQACDVAFMGGSLLPLGGQNPLEPLLLGKPVLMGPSCENFREIVSIFKPLGAIKQEESQEALIQSLTHLIENPTLSKESQKLLEKKRGATQRTLSWLLSRLEFQKRRGE